MSQNPRHWPWNDHHRQPHLKLTIVCFLFFFGFCFDWQSFAQTPPKRKMWSNWLTQIGISLFAECPSATKAQIVFGQVRVVVAVFHRFIGVHFVRKRHKPVIIPANLNFFFNDQNWKKKSWLNNPPKKKIKREKKKNNTLVLESVDLCRPQDQTVRTAGADPTASCRRLISPRKSRVSPQSVADAPFVVVVAAGGVAVGFDRCTPHGYSIEEEVSASVVAGRRVSGCCCVGSFDAKMTKRTKNSMTIVFFSYRDDVTGNAISNGWKIKLRKI